MILTDANLWVALHDDRDALHGRSRAFFERVNRDAIPLHAPAILLVEVACSIARRSRSSVTGREVARKLATHPLLSLRPLDDALVERAQECGARWFLRGADAFYAASAEQTGALLVSWDDQLVKRAKGMTPEDWLAANP